MKSSEWDDSSDSSSDPLTESWWSIKYLITFIAITHLAAMYFVN